MYRERKHIRLRNFDYSSEGIYFITICTKDRNCFFGEIMNHQMVLSEIGNIANKLWNDIPIHFQNVELGEFIVMPNHVHGLLYLNNGTHVGPRHGVDLPYHGVDLPYHGGETNHGGDVRPDNMDPQKNINQFGKPIPGSVSVIINQYKSSVKRCCNKNGYEIFSWQSRFYDHIVRNTKSHNNIKKYIVCNPLNWESDSFRQNES
jgi:putative transposase